MMKYRIELQYSGKPTNDALALAHRIRELMPDSLEAHDQEEAGLMAAGMAESFEREALADIGLLDNGITHAANSMWENCTFTAQPIEPQPAGHTPGPWEHIPPKDLSSSDWCLRKHWISGPAMDASECKSIAHISTWDTQERQSANARLIAAAPELLAACKGMLEWARRVTVKNPGNEIMNAMNAIAKADGRE